MLATSLLLATAWAAPGCEPLDEADFRSFVLDAQTGIDRGDVDLPSQVLQELDARIECLTFAPAPRMWADLMVARAIVAFSSEGDWQTPLDAALWIRPAIDRGVGGSHPIASYEPRSKPELGPELPEGVKVHVNGREEGRAPPDRGMHLVQKSDGPYWNTLLLVDQAAPEGWLEDPVEQPPRIRVWTRLGLVAGVGGVTQTTSWGSDIYTEIGALDGQRAAFGVAGDAQVTILSPAGVLLQGALPITGLSPGTEARLSAIWTWRRLTLGGGIGTTLVDTWEGAVDDPLRRSRMLRYGLGTLLLRPLGRPVPFDLAVSFGASAAVARLDLGVGLLLPEVGSERFRGSLNLSSQGARFQQSGLEDRELIVTGTRVLLRLDWVWGEY